MTDPKTPPMVLAPPLLATRGRGRPRVEAPMTSLTTRLPPTSYDRVAQAARERDTTIASLVRQLLLLQFPPR